MDPKNKQKNVLGEDLEECSNNPLTGWYRDGCCNTDENDHGVHTVCAKVTTEFLEWLKVAGNDEERRSISFNAVIDDEIYNVYGSKK